MSPVTTSWSVPSPPEQTMRSNAPARSAATAVASPAPWVGWTLTSHPARTKQSSTAASLLFSSPFPAWTL